MKSIGLILCFCFFVLQLVDAQREYDLYWVSFKDKQNTPYSLFHPQEYLSAKSIERRRNQGILIDSTDLPIDPTYISKLLEKVEVDIHMESRWFNGIAVKIKDEVQIAEIAKLPFVASTRAIGFVRKRKHPKTGVGAREYKKNYKKRRRYYGDAWVQIQMLNGHYLHKMGYSGQGMTMAVLDAGFEYIKETPAFDSLFARGGIIETRDFVEGDHFVFESSNHGRNVLATITGNLPYLYVGTAPQTSFYLFKTEDELGEYVAEEYNWLAAAEYADQIGIDVINSSLGYYKYDDKDMNYAYEDLDGNTAVITRAADYAAQKGILVLTSAGNEGDGKWQHITVPGDGDSVLTVGAVDREGFHAKFSSKGFSNRHQIKPDVMARGHTAVIPTQYRYNTQYTFGTSFSCPIMAGAATTLWQAVPSVTNMDIIQTLQYCSNQAEEPDTTLGYGIPNFLEAYNQLGGGTVVNINKQQRVYTVPSILNDKVDIFIPDSEYNTLQVHIFDALGQKIYSKQLNATLNELWHHRVTDLDTYPQGSYTIKIEYGIYTYHILLLT
ncbi:MAG: S8 family peptidase [Saprospiraceae bacterium]|nr:S8 family peptidase [Saprospiraceae bacterium]